MRRAGRAVRAAFDRWEWLSELGFVPLALVFSWSLFAIPELPLTHDGLGLCFIESYRRSYKGGNFFPIWNVFGELGHGSGIFILYHRLHAQLTAVLALATGTVVALKVSIPVLLLVGAAGMRRLCRSRGVRPWVAFVAGALVMSANYTWTEWYIRGATAELTAFMLVPWGLRYAFEVFERRWGAVRLALASAAIFYAHMMTSYFFLVIVAGILTHSLVQRRSAGWLSLRAALGRALAFGALCLAAVGPYAAAVTYTVGFSGVGSLGMRSSAGDYFPYSAFLIDPSFSWSRAVVEGQYSVEVGRWLLLCLGVLLVLSPGARASVWRRTGGLAVLAVWFFALQHFGMGFWFDLLPGASKIQFPQRLLVFVVTVTILCTAVAIEAALRSAAPFVRVVARALPLLAVACQGNMARGTQGTIRDAHVEKKNLDDMVAAKNGVLVQHVSSYTSWDDFLPRRHAYPPESAFLSASEGCQIAPGSGQPPGQVIEQNAALPYSFRVVGEHCTVKLGQLQSVLLKVALSAPGSVREADDGMTIIETSGSTMVELRDRGVMDLARKFIVEKTRRRP